MGERVQSYIVTFLILPIEVLDFVTIHRVGLSDEWIDISKFIFLVIPVSYLIFRGIDWHDIFMRPSSYLDYLGSNLLNPY
jgi:hypothetical protein